MNLVGFFGGDDSLARPGSKDIAPNISPDIHTIFADSYRAVTRSNRSIPQVVFFFFRIQGFLVRW